jgi:trimeric autotransporter adhesin
MTRVLLTILMVFTAGMIYGQTTYYWVGGLTAVSTAGVTTGTNWNTSLDGSGSTRPSATGTSDILVFDGTNLGGSTPVTGAATVNINGSISCAQIIFVNNANISWVRMTSGTSTITINGELGEDFVINSGTKLSWTSTVGSIRVALLANTTARCSGSLEMNTIWQARFDNTTSGTPGSFVFTNGSSFTSNITSSSSSYAFGSSSQSSPEWVVFEDGAHLYYNGGWSPNGNSSAFSPILFKPGSFWHHRFAFTLATPHNGSFFNKKSFGNVIIENNITQITDGPILRSNNFTVNTGSTFTTHTTGVTAIMGNLTVDGTLNTGVGNTNEIVFAGNGNQTVSGNGTISVPGLIVGNHSTTILNKNMALTADANIYGKINFTDKQITAVVDFTAKGMVGPEVGSGTTVAGSYLITAHSGISTTARGQKITGPGIPANTTVVSVSITDDQIFISNPATASGIAVALTITSGGATLQNANTNGYDPATGSVVASGNMSFQNNINYIIDGASSLPFGVTTGSSGNMIQVGFVEANADITVNKGLTIQNYILVNGKVVLRPADLLHIVSGATINGSFGPTKYIATDYVTATGVQSVVQYDGISSSKIIPIGTVNFYLPVTINPVVTSNFNFAVFQGITTNGLLNGTAFSGTQKLRVVNAVWNVNRLSGSGNADLQLGWNEDLEGTTFTTLPSSEIGLIRNIGSGPTGWAPPVGTGDNLLNEVMGTVTDFGSFGAGAVPQTNAFVYNDLPVKTYGDPDFNGGATSLNTTNPIVYTSSNLAVAIIVSGNIRIIGAGISDITASQTGDGVFPDTSATKQLTVEKAALNIKADDKSRFEQLANPPLTITFTGFVLGQTNSVLITQPSISTTAIMSSAPGVYPITVSGATADNYTITHTNGTLTVIAKTNQTITFPAPTTKTYGNAAFATGATSTNGTIPITYTSSNPGVATVSGNTITITGAGTTDITAMQAGNDGFFPAPNVVRTLTVNKVNLTVRATDTTKVTGEINPNFRLVYTGFVLGETAANLNTAPVVTTSANSFSSPGYYNLIPANGVSQNYNLLYTNGRLTILPTTGASVQYMNAYRNSSGSLTVRVFAQDSKLADIAVYGLNGIPVARKNILLINGFSTVTIPISVAASGIYIVSIKGDGVDLYKKINLIK